MGELLQKGSHYNNELNKFRRKYEVRRRNILKEMMEIIYKICLMYKNM